MAETRPLVSVITATYDWSTALGCAIESARLQTFGDFEHLIVGDGCTDDSADVVASFDDPRLRWINLPANSGGQAIPNNHGLTLARGTFIAYLGHDDIWFPTHLETLLDTMRKTTADMAGAVMIHYGPPGTRVRGVSGVFATGAFSARDFMPPTSLMHTAELVTRIGPWEDGSVTRQPTDVEFQQRAFATGARIVSTGVLTAFKFNAASRRNAYRIRDTRDQERMLQRIRTGVDFRQQELVDVIGAVAAEQYIRIEAPPAADPGFHASRTARFKGTSRQPATLTPIRQPMRFRLDDQLPGFEWYEAEATDRWGTARWSGPATASSLEFPVRAEGALLMRVHVVGHMLEDVSRDVTMLVDGEPVAWEPEPTPEGSLNLRAQVTPRGGDRPLSLTLRLARLTRPIDVGLGDDRRPLGLAVSWVDFEPVP